MIFIIKYLNDWPKQLKSNRGLYFKMRRLAIIHIGMHKTGTTTIQSRLSANRDSLLENGVLYPTSGAISTGGHLNLVYETIASWNFKPNLGSWKDVVDETNKHNPPVIILSAENFSGARKTKEIIESVKLYCKEVNADPVIVGYLRPQHSYVNSLYAQNAATGYTAKSFSDYLFENLSSDQLCFEHVFGPWLDSFSTHKILPYEREIDTPIVTQFLNQVGLEKIDLATSEEEKLNVRLGARAVECARKATQILENVKSLPKAKRHLVAKSVASKCTERFPDDLRFCGLDQNTALSIENFFSSSNKEFYTSRLGTEKLFATSVADTVYKKNMLSLDSASFWEMDRFLNIYSKAISQVIS